MDPEGGRWLLRARTSRLLFASSVVVLATGCLILVLGNFSDSAILRTLGTDPALYLPMGAILSVNALCAVFILVAMLWYWLRFDDSRRIVKVLWLVSFLALGWYSMSIYYFIVYRPQRRLAGASQ